MPALWDLPDFDAHESVHLFDDAKTGMRAVIAIHSTHNGPAAGGTRFWHYADQQAAITDALRLSRGMSYKNAMAGLPAGGGKAVILADNARTKTQDRLDAFARAVDSLGGRYITAPLFGYDTALPQRLGLYRLLSTLTSLEALAQGRVVHFSAGVGPFKRLRGGQAAIEYNAVYTRHLPAGWRRPWRFLQVLMDRLP